MAIAEGKKRYYLTLNEERFERLKKLFRTVGAKSGMESEIIDQFIAGVLPTVEHLIKIKEEQNREPSLADLMVILGGQLQSLGEDQLKL
jgi:hypothetical protein